MIFQQVFKVMCIELVSEVSESWPLSCNKFVGRTGRAGREGKAVTFFTDEDAPYLKMCVYQCYSAAINLLVRIANVILQSGFTVPEWILRLPKPSKMKRKQMGKLKRADFINSARNIGRRDAVKKRFANITFVYQI